LDGVPREYKKNILIERDFEKENEGKKMKFDLSMGDECWFTKKFPRIEKSRIKINDEEIKKTINECELIA